MFNSLTKVKFRTHKVILAITLCFIFSSFARAEEQQAADQNNSVTSPPENSRLARFKAAARARLIKRLTNKDATPSKIVVLPPVDYTALQQSSIATETIRKAIQQYDKKIDVQASKHRMDSLTLEHFRKAMIKERADVLLTLIMHPTNFDIYLYDARTPYQIYAHSEPISSGAQYELTREAVAYYTKILIRRTLYRYIKSQYYELPREESATVLQSEIPRHVASVESLEKINREAYSNWYVTAGLGAALSSGASTSRWWNSNLLSGGIGRRVYDDYYVEAFADLASYNVLGLFGKYVLIDKHKSFKVSLGLGGGLVASRRTLNWDINDDIDSGTFLVGGSGTILLPIADIYLKAEGRVYYGVNKKALIVNILPGLLFVF